MSQIIADRVKEQSTTTGTGPLTLSGALTSMVTFAAKCAVGDTVPYVVEAVDALGNPSGAWEVGVGTYSAANTLTRTTVLASSNAGAAVDFAAGAKHVMIGLNAAMASSIREKLTAARTYYVATTGSDASSGLAVGTPFLTIQKAIDVICKTLDTQGFDVTIQVADGTYTGGVTLRAKVGAGNINITGNASTPGNCIISTTNAHCFFGGVGVNYVTALNGFKLVTTTAGNQIYATYSTAITFSNIEFGACANTHISAETGGRITALTNYSISGSASAGNHIFAYNGGVVIISNRTVTLTGTPAFSVFIYLETAATVMIVSSVFTGSATGTQYAVRRNSVLRTDTGAGVTLPGSVGGATSFGGIFA